MIDVFLFAHQDDEYGVFHLIEQSVACGRRPLCLYLTNGDFGGQDVAVRNRESLGVLQKLGVLEDDCVFVGQEEKISDGQLVNGLEAAYQAVLSCLKKKGAEVHAIYLLSYEGGHQDHDAAYVVGCRLVEVMGIARAWQFSLYNGRGLPGILFRVLAPVVENGRVYNEPISFSGRCRYIGYCLSYRSQWKTWLALLPFVLAHYVFYGTQSLQKVSAARCLSRPHEGALLYERRGALGYEDFLDKVEFFLRERR